MKKVANIVFYKYYGENGESKQACIFYNDGTVASVSYVDGLSVCEEIAKERKIKSKDAFKEMINKDIIHVVSAEEFEEKFNSYISYDIVDKKEISETIENELSNIPVIEATVEEAELIEESEPVLVNEANETEDENKKLFDDEIKEETPIVLNDIKTEMADEKNYFIPLKDKKIVDLSGIDKVKPESAYLEENNDFKAFVNMDTVDLPNMPLQQEEKPRVYKAKVEDKGKGIGAFFRRKFERAKKANIMTKVAACALTLALGFGLYSASAKQTKEGDIIQAFASTSQASDSSDLRAGDNDSLVRGNNEYYNDYTFEQLLEVTVNPVQKRTMNKLGYAIQNFNGKFADAYVEEGKDIRAALTFDEIVALQQAYNDYSKKDIKAIFNGAEIKASDLTRAYKDASLQLMGAHVIETRENPVDMSNLLETEEAKAFYEKYHEMFLACKEATGQEQLDRVNKFYAAVKADFPITQKIRTEGIAHADAYKSIESYKLSVTPMIAAAEMMYQNLEVDYTLNDGEIDFLNDIGLCNYADDKFERIETITLSSCEDDMENPLYEQYRNAIIKMMTEKNQYVIDDAHRDLSQLDSFQNAVNWHFEMVDGYFTGYTYYTTETYTESRSWSTSNTKKTTKVTKTEKPIPAKEKEKIDKQIEQENKLAKKAAEKEAEKTRKEMQKEEDKKAEIIREEVKQDEKDLQDKIEQANEQIEENNKDQDKTNDDPVNESDFGDHNVDFDDQHSDSDGNLNDSVENITTDDSDVHTPADLPDPNVTGAEFDKQAPKEEAAPAPEPKQEAAPEVKAEPKQETKASSPSNEEIVDKYVEDMAKDSKDSDDKSKEKVLK